MLHTEARCQTAAPGWQIYPSQGRRWPGILVPFQRRWGAQRWEAELPGDAVILSESCLLPTAPSRN